MTRDQLQRVCETADRARRLMAEIDDLDGAIGRIAAHGVQVRCADEQPILADPDFRYRLSREHALLGQMVGVYVQSLLSTERKKRLVELGQLSLTL